MSAKNTACRIRLQKDFDDIPTLGNVTIKFPEDGNPQHFIARIRPEVGIWRGGNFDFDIQIPDEWPIEKPKVKIITRIWHPNIDEPPECGVCLNILRQNYSPAMTIDQMLAGIQYLFTEPNPLDPLNKDAADQYVQNYAGFKNRAEEYIREYCPEDDDDDE